MPPEALKAPTTRVFEYRARKADGTEVRGRAAVASELDLDRQLLADGLTLVDAQISKRLESARARVIPQGELVSITGQLATMIDAGLPILKSLTLLKDHAQTESSRQVLDSIQRQIEGGASLSEALESHPRSFPETYVAMVRSGELSSSIPDVLRRQGSYLEWVRDVRGMTKQAMIYPATLALAVVGLVVILLTFLIPRLVGLFPGGQEDLPSQTRFVMGISDFFAASWPYMLGGVGAAGFGFYFVLQGEAARCAFSRAILHIPRLGKVLRMISVARFATTAAALHASGCEIVRTLEISADACGNAWLRAAFMRVTGRVRGGEMIHEALGAEDLDAYLVQLTAVGETSGQLGSCLQHLADSYNAEVPRAVRWALSLIEPAVIIVGGVIVGFLLLAAILPVFKIYETL